MRTSWVYLAAGLLLMESVPVRPAQAQPLPRSRVERWRQVRALSRRSRRRVKPRPLPGRVKRPRRHAYRLGVRHRLPPTWTGGALTGGRVGRGFSVRADRDGIACMRSLRRLRVAFRVSKPQSGIPAPIFLTSSINGLRLEKMWGTKGPTLVNCRFALALYRIAPIVRRVGFIGLRYSSTYRRSSVVKRSGRPSRHASAMAIDVHELFGPRGFKANVLKDWIKFRGRPGNCVGRVRTRKAVMLRRLVCELEKSRLVRLIMTPDTDYAHRDHFHISGLKKGEHRPKRYRYAGRFHRP